MGRGFFQLFRSSKVNPDPLEQAECALCISARLNADSDCVYKDDLASTDQDEVLQLRRQLHDANIRLKDKDRKINELMKNQKSIDLDLHNLTEQLFQQAYKLVNDEKKRIAELKIRVDMLEAENADLKSTVTVHKRPAFSHRLLSPSSLMTPVKLTKTPFRTLLSRYTNRSSDNCADSQKVTLMESLSEEESPADSKLAEQLLSVQTENKDLNVLLVEFEKRIRQIKDENCELKERLNVKDKEICELSKSRDDALEKCMKVESIINSLSE